MTTNSSDAFVPSAMDGDPAMTNTVTLPNLYDRAAAFEVEMERANRHHPDTPLTAAEVGTFNYLLREARALLPNSHTLREDVDFVEALGQTVTRPAAIHHALNRTIGPTLRNALPDPALDARG